MLSRTLSATKIWLESEGAVKSPETKVPARSAVDAARTAQSAALLCRGTARDVLLLAYVSLLRHIIDKSLFLGPVLLAPFCEPSLAQKLQGAYLLCRFDQPFADALRFGFQLVYLTFEPVNQIGAGLSPACRA